ncbi:hypothetical protein IMZ31_22420 (plasmid) [Pontibacillus sp. ALD_SL1]|uniref:hypothetical protein n=1 Tax=Pontibacillus sp. ALD_SL1 TaxID=2777185 RepID=UPI001A95D09D|nr:hypothetical protein [Pontibacillus sp. ALD_SL1]QST02211.1 hypothetical protein IMZ31_22420 [Pontibacillus sp. ALD_SL1]
MKKLFPALMLLSILFVAACSDDSAEPKEDENTSQEKTNDTEQQSEETKDEGKMEVDKGLLNVKVTLPASMVEGENIEDIKANAKEQGIKEVTQNDDGSVTYKMSKSTHKEMMSEIKGSVEDSIEQMKTSGEYASIEDVTYNDSFSEFTMIVNKEKFENSMDGFASMTLGMSGIIYQMYEGKSEEDAKVTIKMEDAETGEVFDETVYPDAMDNMGE